jgi:hypothetical protein
VTERGRFVLRTLSCEAERRKSGEWMQADGGATNWGLRNQTLVAATASMHAK